MKTRESGMPPQEMWQSYFNPETILHKLGLTPDCQCVVDFGCGFGTFSIPAAKMVSGKVHAVDIDPDMIAATRVRAGQLPNLNIWQRDFVVEGCGLSDGSADYAMLFNILHCEEAPMLLAEAKRVLRPGGKLGVMHWNYDPNTPRGPSMNIRLKPQECIELVERAGFHAGDLVDFAPYHYGFVATR